MDDPSCNTKSRLATQSISHDLTIDEGVQALRALFPGWDAAHIVGTVHGPGDKATKTVAGPPADDVIRAHLAASADVPFTVYGVSPKVRTANGDVVAHYVLVDLDIDEDDAIRATARHLDAGGVPSYLARSTSGRGWHMYVFLAGPVDGQVAPALSRKLADAVKHCSRGTVRSVDHFPSSGVPGAMHYLPYRGASADGAGMTPLTDAVTGEVIELNRTALILRAAATDLERSLEALLPTAATVQRATPDDSSPTNAQPSDRESLIAAEARRIARAWKPGVRQNLALGFAGYAAALGANKDHVRHIIRELALAEGEGKEELARRMIAVKRTFQKRESNHPTAYVTFYERAGLPAPAFVRLPPTEPVAAVLGRAALQEWTGVRGNGDAVLLIALADTFLGVGRLANPSVAEANVACRDLALKTNASPITAARALKRLAQRGLIERMHVKAPRSHAAAYAMTSTRPDAKGTATHTNSLFGTLAQQVMQNKGLSVCVAVALHPAFHLHALGPKTGLVALALKFLGPSTLEALTNAFGGPVKDSVEKLVNSGAAWHKEGTLFLVDDVVDHLDRWATVRDAFGKRQRKGKRIAEQRAAYAMQRSHWLHGETPEIH